MLMFANGMNIPEFFCCIVRLAPHDPAIKDAIRRLIAS
jgi:hypothetical protein